MDKQPLSKSRHGDGDVELPTVSQPNEESAEEVAKREELRLLKIRKKQELKLVKKFDKSKINVSRECWFLIDSDWLNAWSAFVNGTAVEDPPGPLSTKELLDDKGNPAPNLKAIRDYRGVPPIVYFMFLELYGKDDSPEIARYEIDIYKSTVPVAKMVNIQVTGRSQAKIHVNRVRPKWIKWEREYEEDEEDGMIWCCGLTKEHLEAFIYWAIMCWASSRRKSGRADISYRKYKPLRTDSALLEEEDAAQQAAQQGRAGQADEGAGEGGEAWLEARRAAEASRSAEQQTVTVVVKKKARKRRAPPPQKLDASAGRGARAAAAARRAQGGGSESSSSSSDSDAEMELMLQSAPADVNVESGTWLAASKWWGFGR